MFLNAWAIHHDEARYNDVDVFRPERFLDAKEQSVQSHYSFGAGRRMCAGVFLAERELYIAFSKVRRRRLTMITPAALLTPTTAQLIYFFRILPGEEDYDIDPATACANPRGLSSAPKPFKVRFEPRNLSSIRSFLEEEKTKAEHAMAAGIGAGSTAVEKEAAAA